MRFDRENQSLPVPADLVVVKEATHIDTQRLVCLKLHSQNWCNCNQASQDADSHHTVHARDEASSVFHEVASPPHEHKQWDWVRCSFNAQLILFNLWNHQGSVFELYRVQKLGNSWLNNHFINSWLKLWSSLDLSQVLNLTRANLCKMNSKSWSGTSLRSFLWISFCCFLWSCFICILTSTIQKPVGPKRSRSLSS